MKFFGMILIVFLSLNVRAYELGEVVHIQQNNLEIYKGDLELQKGEQLRAYFDDIKIFAEVTEVKKDTAMLEMLSMRSQMGYTTLTSAMI